MIKKTIITGFSQKNRINQIIENLLDELEHIDLNEALMIVEEFNKKFDEQKRKRDSSNN